MESSKKVKVVNHRDSRVVLRRVVSKPGEQVLFDQLVLDSGAQNVDSAELDKYLQNPNSKAFFDIGMCTVEPCVEGTLDALPAYGADISKAKPKIALNAIAQCKDPRQLKLWLKTDGRPEIRNALIARHEELLKAEPEENTDAE